MVPEGVVRGYLGMVEDEPFGVETEGGGYTTDDGGDVGGDVGGGGRGFEFGV